MAEATELLIVPAEHRRLGESRTGAFAEATITNVGRPDTTLRIAEIRRHAPCPHNDQEDKSTGGTSTQNRQLLARCRCKLRRTEEKEAERGMDTLQLKTGEKI